MRTSTNRLTSERTGCEVGLNEGSRMARCHSNRSYCWSYVTLMAWRESIVFLHEGFIESLLKILFVRQRCSGLC
jgi:hypothetical protein